MRNCLATGRHSKKLTPGFPGWVPIALLILSLGSPGVAQEPLRDVINRSLAPITTQTVGRASDAEFLRRVSIDLTGMPPSADTAAAFLTDSAIDRREQLIDRLLDSPRHHRHLAEQLSVMLMERRTAKHVAEVEWLNWLTRSVREDKPWNVLVREILLADGEPGEQRPAAAFILNRDAEPHTVARDIGRIFFGQDLQCAQCHDSPLVSDFLQQDYQGLLAVSSSIATFTRKVDKKDLTLLRDQAGSDITFESVFAKGSPHRTGARIPGGTTLVEPFRIPSEEYTIAPADGIRSVPVVSRRQWLADVTTDGSNLHFNRNAANRIWSLMFGKGLVHPLDMLHPDNPSASPGLLEDLASRFAQSGFQIRNLLREIALSDPYQFPFDLPTGFAEQVITNDELVRQVQQRSEKGGEQLDRLSQTRDAADERFDEAETAVLPTADAQDKARTASVAALAKYRKAADELNAAEAKASTNTELKTRLEEAVAALDVTLQQTSEEELSNALATLKQRLQKTVEGTAALQKAVTDRKTAAEPLEAAWKESAESLRTAAAASAPLVNAMLQEEQQRVLARKAWQQQQFELTSLSHREDLLQQVGSLQETRQTLMQLQTAGTAVARDLAASTANLAATRSLVEKSKTDVVRITVDFEEQMEMLGTTKDQLETSVSAQKLIAESVAAANTASAALIGEETLVALTEQLSDRLRGSDDTVRNLRSRSEQLTALVGKTSVAMEAAHAEAKKLQTELANNESAHEELQGKQQQIQHSLQEAVQQQTRHQDELPELLSRHFQLSDLRPLSPEQLCWSILQVTGVYERTRQAAVAELDKSNPLQAETAADPAVLRQRELQIEQTTWEKLRGNQKQFITLYGAAAGQPQGDFFASADQALFASNGSTINSWVAPAGDNTTQRIIAAESAQTAAEALYLGVLTRSPTVEEVREVEQVLRERPDRRTAASELVWALIMSAEFRFNR